MVYTTQFGDEKDEVVVRSNGYQHILPQILLIIRINLNGVLNKLSISGGQTIMAMSPE